MWMYFTSNLYCQCVCHSSDCGRLFLVISLKNVKNLLVKSELRASSVTQSVMSRRFPTSTRQISQLCSCFISSALFYSSLTETTGCRPLDQTLNLAFGPALNLICCHSDCLWNLLSHIRTALWLSVHQRWGKKRHFVFSLLCSVWLNVVALWQSSAAVRRDAAFASAPHVWNRTTGKLPRSDRDS